MDFKRTTDIQVVKNTNRITLDYQKIDPRKKKTRNKDREHEKLYFKLLMKMN